MNRGTDEAEWKTLRRLHPVVLERFCERVLGEIERIRADPGKSSHERYLEVYRLIQRRDRELAQAFNDMRRSMAVARLAAICSLDLLTEEEFGQFSEKTRETVEFLLGRTPLR